MTEETKTLTRVQQDLLEQAKARPGVREAMDVFQRANEQSSTHVAAAEPQIRYSTGANR